MAGLPFTIKAPVIAALWMPTPAAISSITQRQKKKIPRAAPGLDPFLCASKCSTTLPHGLFANLQLIEPFVSRRPWRCCVDFSPPLLTYGIAFLYDARQVSFFEALIGCLTNVFFINFISFIFILIVIVSHLVWFFERRSNPDQFPTEYADGIDDAVWWSLVTITTVGYGDKVPTTPGGKFIAVIWLFIGLFLYSILSGHMASTFSDIRDRKIFYETVDDLISANVRICSYPSQFATTGRLGLIKTSKQVMRSDTVGCTDALMAGEVDVVVMDHFSLRNWLSTNPAAQKTYSIGQPPSLGTPARINQYTVSIVYPEGTTAAGEAARPYRDLIDPVIGDFVREPLAETIRNKWAPKPPAVSGEEVEPLQWELIGTANAFIFVYLCIKFFLCVKKPENRQEMVRLSRAATSARIMVPSGSGNSRPAAPVAEELQTVVVPIGKNEAEG